MKKTDFQMQKGSEKVEFKRGATIDGKATILTAEVTLNNKKGLFNVINKLSYDHITGDEALDQATLNAVSDIKMEAIKYCLKWRAEWESKQPKDPDNPKIEFPEQDDE